jgi:hypothetical protein
MDNLTLHSATYLHPEKPFVPPGFEVPMRVTNEQFLLRPITIRDAEKDYEAVMESRRHLHELWGPGWPDELTLEQNTVDLGWHQKEFQRRHSFTYTVMTPYEVDVLGCVYIYPSRLAGVDAEIYQWVRRNQLASGLEEELVAFVRQWIQQDWPFERPVFPGRD